MKKFKITRKITLSLFTILQLGTQIKGSDLAVIDLPPFQSAIEEIGEAFGVIRMIDEIKAKFVTIYEQKFIDLENYPEMSLSDLGDEIITILDHTSDLPDDIRQNLKKLVTIKKMANNITEIKAPHPLVSETLIQLANFKLARINDNMSVLLKHFNMQDLVKINQEIITYKNSVEKLRTRKIYKSIDDVETDLKKLLDKIKIILKEHPLYLAFITRSATEEKPLTALEQAAEKMKLLKIFNYRIAQNKRK